MRPVTTQARWLARAHDLCVQRIYATHNQSRSIRRAIALCLQQLESDGLLGLNVGAGMTRIHPRMLNLDVVPAPTVDVCATAEHLPFPGAVFDLVLSQEVLEHVRDPFQAMREMKRVLKNGGILYLQVPFIIGYHPGPSDFWRFTKEGICEMVQQAGLTCLDLKMAVGPGTGFYRIIVEFIALSVARLWAVLYLPVKAVSALLFYPLKWLDPFLEGSPQADRIPGGYLVIVRREERE